MEKLDFQFEKSLSKAILAKMPEGFLFKPTKRFYSETGLKQKRFGQLWRGEKEPLRSEMQAIAAYFNLDISELL